MTDLDPQTIKLGLDGLSAVPHFLPIRFPVEILPPTVAHAIEEAATAHRLAVEARSRLIELATPEHRDEAVRLDRLDQDKAVEAGHFDKAMDSHVRDFAERVEALRREVQWRTDRAAFLIVELTSPIMSAKYSGELGDTLNAAKADALRPVLPTLDALGAALARVDLVDQVGQWITAIEEGRRTSVNMPDPSQAAARGALSNQLAQLVGLLPELPVVEPLPVVDVDQDETESVRRPRAGTTARP